MDILIRDPKFWTAVVLLSKTILFYALPDFPSAIWQAVDALLAVIIGTLAGVESRRIVVARRAVHKQE